MNEYVYILIGMTASFLLCITMLLVYLKYQKSIAHQQYQMKVSEVLHQKELIKAIIISQEQERKRIGMDLHDEIGASLSAVKIMMQLKKNVDHDLDKIINTVRNISHNLSPTIKGNFGFSDAIYEYCEKLSHSQNLKININFQNEKAEIFLKDENALAVYRILIELITNTQKHANASEISILFYILNEMDFVVDYKDNGVGVDLENIKYKKGIGLKNIESRLGIMNAKMEIKYVSKGSFMQIVIPIINE